ncbi:MAG: VWA domain-containing protein [Bacteroidales bacterium]|nr:VWA domain-containing protein [Bacteroidales bacterium]
MFRFENIGFIYLLVLIPVLLVVFIIGRKIRKRSLKRFGDPDILNQLMPFLSVNRPVVKFLFILIALVFIILGMARPQFGSKLEEIKRKGIEIVIALDVSNSMLAEDIQPNRLEKAKQAIERLVEKLADDKIGLIVFAGNAYVQIPITSDYASAKMFLSSINTQIVPKQGTAIGSAIDLGINSFSPDNEASKALIIITDGEDHEDDAVSMAKEAAEKGIVIHVIGVGTPDGSPIPVYSGGQRSFRKDRDGNTVITKLNEKILREITSAGNGSYIRATNSRLGLNMLFDQINAMEKQEMDIRKYSEYDEKFQYMIGLALILILFDFILLERKNKYLKNIKLFN